MALTVENGTGLSAADAYISVMDADIYHAAMNNTAWATLSSAQKEAAIRYATIYLDSRYSWRGTIVEDDQALGMPTEDGYDDQGREITGLPAKVANACAEMALMHHQNPVNAVMEARVIAEEVTGAVRVQYSDRNGNEGVRYPVIDRMIKGLYTGGGIQFIESMAS